MIRTLASRLLDLALPGSCAGCGREGDVLCAACLPALHERLGLPPGLPIGLPSDIPAPLLQLEWSAPFNGTVRRALHALKYAGERRLAEPLGKAVAARWRVARAGGDLVVPVPVHRDRELERGFDQAVLLATVAARDLHLPMARLLVRRRATRAQYRLDHAERAANVSDAFGPAGVGSPVGRWVGRPVGPWVGSPAGRWVVLVDDVVTTGATLAACAEVLLAAGAGAVSAVTVARER